MSFYHEFIFFLLTSNTSTLIFNHTLLNFFASCKDGSHDGSQVSFQFLTRFLKFYFMQIWFKMQFFNFCSPFLKQKWYGRSRFCQITGSYLPRYSSELQIAFQSFLSVSYQTYDEFWWKAELLVLEAVQFKHFLKVEAVEEEDALEIEGKQKESVSAKMDLLPVEKLSCSVS